jgi:predicted nucleotidyltransferase
MAVRSRREDSPMGTVRRGQVVPAAVAVELRRLGDRYGIRNLRVFGSFARGDAREDSDVDLLVDYVPGQSGFAFVRFCQEAERLLGRDVDVTTEAGLHPMIRESVLAETVPL